MAPATDATLDDLRSQTSTAHQHQVYQAARYQDAIALLPPLLNSAEALHRTVPAPDRREMLLSYVSAYVVAAKLLTKLGVGDIQQAALQRLQVGVVGAGEFPRDRGRRRSVRSDDPTRCC